MKDSASKLDWRMTSTTDERTERGRSGGSQDSRTQTGALSADLRCPDPVGAGVQRHAVPHHPGPSVPRAFAARVGRRRGLAAHRVPAERRHLHADPGPGGRHDGKGKGPGGDPGRAHPGHADQRPRHHAADHAGGADHHGRRWRGVPAGLRHHQGRVPAGAGRGRNRVPLVHPRRRGRSGHRPGRTDHRASQLPLALLGSADALCDRHRDDHPVRAGVPHTNPGADQHGGGAPDVGLAGGRPVGGLRGTRPSAGAARG